MTKHTIPVTVGSLGDFETEHWTAEDWESWKQQVEQLKESGEFGKTYETTISVTHNPTLDDVGKGETLTSTDFIILDLGK